MVEREWSGNARSWASIAYGRKWFEYLYLSRSQSY